MQATLILPIHLANIDKGNANVLGVSKLKNRCLVYTYSTCGFIYGHIKVNIRLVYHDALIKGNYSP